MLRTIAPLAALTAALVLLPAATSGAAVPSSVTIVDPARDQTHGDLWARYPRMRPASDLRRAVFATERGTLRLTWTFAATPPARAHQTPGMSAGLPDGRQLTFVAWKRTDGSSYASISTGLGSDSRYYCKGRTRVSLNAAAHQVTLRVPVSCLPPGRVLRSPYATSALTVLRRSGVVEGYVASDSSLPGANFRIR